MIPTTLTLPSRPVTRTAIAMLVVGAMSICATVARAETPEADVPQVLVSYSDLNLSKDQDARALYKRIAMAARHVCPDQGALSVRVAAARRRCVSEAIARAVRNVDSPKLAEVEASYSRRSKVG